MDRPLREAGFFYRVMVMTAVGLFGMSFGHTGGRGARAQCDETRPAAGGLQR